MAETKRILEQYIKSRRAKGESDSVIFANLTKRKDPLGRVVNGMMVDARKSGIPMKIAASEFFGLNLTPTKTAKNGGFLDKVGSALTSFSDGLKNSIGGLEQGQMWIKDKMAEGINTVVGKDIAPTDSLDRYNLGRKADDTVRKEYRAKAGLDGFDLSKFGGEIAGTAPVMMGGGAMGTGLKGTAKFLGREAALGTTSGAMREADNAGQRGKNMAFEGVGGAVGGVVGEKIVAPVVRKVGSKIARRSANKMPSRATSSVDDIGGSGGGPRTARGTKEAAERLVDDGIRTSRIDVADDVRQQLIRDAEQFLKVGKEVNGPAFVRKSLLEKYGIKGTKAQITRNPADWTAEQEAAKYSDKLNNVHIKNHEQLDNLMRDLVGETGAQPIETYHRMQSTFKTLKDADDAAQKKVGELYDNARNLSGNDAQLNHYRFIDQSSRELEENGLGSFLKGDIRGIFKGMFDDPDFVLTHGKSEELIKVINKRMRSTSDGNERMALGIIKDNLSKEVDRSIDEMTGLIGYGQSDGGLAATKEAWTTARNTARERFETLEKTPMLKAAVDDVEPDKALDKYILKGNVADIVRTVDVLKNTPGGEQAIADLQGSVIEHFLSQATKSNNGAFSPAGLNRAIQSFGNTRMKALFTPEQVARLNDIKQVVDILTQQPLGAHVNHSNTASVLIKQLLGIVGMVGHVPKVGGLASGIAIGAINKAQQLAADGAALRMINPPVPVTKNSSLGLTLEMLEMLGLIERGSSVGGASIGAAAAGD